MIALCFVMIIAVFSGFSDSSALAAEITGRGFPLQGGQIASSSQPQSIQSVSAQQPAAPVPASPQNAPAGQTVSQTVTQAGRAPGETPLQFPGAERRRPREPREFTLPSILPAILSVLAVCGLFFGVLYLMKRYLPGHKQMFAHPAMEFLGRTHLDQKRFVSILRVGRRIVVVGVSPEEMHTLSEITDEAEVTEILEIARPKTETGLTMFQKLFQRNVLDVEAAEAKADAEIKAAELDEQMSSIRERVRNINANAANGRRDGHGNTQASPRGTAIAGALPGTHLDAVG